jgi:phosphoglycolate phosphatase
MKVYKLLIFDLDGTLIDSKRDIAESVNYAFKKLHIPQKRYSEIYKFIGNGGEQLIRDVIDKRYEDLVPEVVRIYREYYKNHVVVYTKLYPGVKRILKYYMNKIKVVITNKYGYLTREILKRLKIDEYFDRIVGWEDTEAHKPSPEPILEVIQQYGISKEEAIVIGDGVQDIKAAKNACVDCCGVLYGFTKKEELIKEAPTYVVEKIVEIKNIVL